MKTRSLIFICTPLLLALACSSKKPNPGTNDSGTGGPTCDPSSCPSGACSPDDTCAPGCKSDSDCASGETCCNGAYCSDLTKDPQNCGACGTACGGQQFCSGSACVDAKVKNVCQNAAGTVVLDNIDVDDTAGSALATTLQSACSSMKLATVTQGAQGTMDSQSGRPTTGPGNAYVAAGGSFGQKAIAYMNGARNAPVFTVDDSQNIAFMRTSDGSTIISAPINSLTAHHDYFLVYAAQEPVSGTLVFAAYGLYPAGTAAAAYWLTTQQIGNLDKQYYVFQWDDTNNDGKADSGDAFKQLDAQ